MKSAKLVRFHTKTPSIGLYHTREDCPHAKKIKAWNVCFGGGMGCYWCDRKIMLDPCPVCATAAVSFQQGWPRIHV